MKGTELDADSGFLQEAMGTEAGRRTMLFLLAQMGIFGEAEDPRGVAVRNAAVRVLKIITEKTGFSLDMDLTRER